MASTWPWLSWMAVACPSRRPRLKRRIMSLSGVGPSPTRLRGEAPATDDPGASHAHGVGDAALPTDHHGIAPAGRDIHEGIEYGIRVDSQHVGCADHISADALYPKPEFSAGPSGGCTEHPIGHPVADHVHAALVNAVESPCGGASPLGGVGAQLAHPDVVLRPFLATVAGFLEQPVVVAGGEDQHLLEPGGGARGGVVHRDGGHTA